MPANRLAIPRAERVDAILDAARAEFDERGFEGTTMAAIARRSGMTSANVHYYFDTKERLYATCAERAYEQLFDALEAEPDPLERLHHYIAFHATNRPSRGAFLALAARNPEVGALLQRRDDWVEQTVGTITNDALSAAAIAAVVTGLVETVSVPHDPRTILNHAVDLLT